MSASSVPPSEPDQRPPRQLPRRYDELAPRPPEGPIELPRIAPKHREIELEIGFGRGMFVIERAQHAPHVFVLGIEIKRKWAYRVAQRCQRLGLQNVSVMAGDVREILPRISPQRGLARAFMHFPDPWWKKRHAKRRLVGDELLDALAAVLRPQGELFVQTDVEERAERFAQDLSEHAAFELQGRLEANPYGARSNREKRAIEDGLPVYRVLAHRLP